jgi:hypothetical protein
MGYQALKVSKPALQNEPQPGRYGDQPKVEDTKASEETTETDRLAHWGPARQVLCKSHITLNRAFRSIDPQYPTTPVRPMAKNFHPFARRT